MRSVRRHGTTAVLAAGLVLVSLAVAFAQPTWLLRYNWEQGETITWLVDMEAGGELTTRDMNSDPPKASILELTTLMTMSQYKTVEAVDADGNATVLTRIGTIEMDMTVPPMGAQHITVNAETGEITAAGTAVPAPQGLARLLAEPLKQVLSPRGEVLEVELPSGLADLMGFGSPGPMQVLKSLQERPMMLPEEEIGIGHCWIDRHDLAPAADDEAELPPVTQTITYRLAGIEDLAGVECLRIELLGVIDLGGTITMPMTGEGREGTTTMGPAHLSMSGTIWFDPAAGTPVKKDLRMLLDMQQEMEGSIKIEDDTHDFHVQVEMNGFEIDLTVERIEEG